MILNMTKNLKSSIAQTRAQVIKFTRYVDKWEQDGEELKERAARNMLNIYVKKLDDLRAELKKQIEP